MSDASDAICPATLRARAPQDSDLPTYDQALDPAQSAFVGSEIARWTASIAAASASAAALAQSGPPVGAMWKYQKLTKDYNTPQADEIMCRAKPKSPTWVQDNCIDTLKDICGKLLGSANATVAADTWVWSSAGGEGCSLGYFYPSAARGVAPVPSRQLCEDDLQGIWGQMYRSCIPRINPDSGKWNAASMNVKELPKGSNNGQPVDPRQAYDVYQQRPSDWALPVSQVCLTARLLVNISKESREKQIHDNDSS
ncbi:MAG: hypothetical protein Q9191_000196 [Dirinaria sp. TL-2023a]